MKKLITVCVLAIALVLGCAATQPAVQECEPAVVDEFSDHAGNLILFVDEDCNKSCDAALLLQFVGRDENDAALYVPIALISCEEAEAIIKAYKKQQDNNSINF